LRQRLGEATFTTNLRVLRDLIKEKIVTVGHVKSNLLLFKFTIAPHYIEKFSEPWVDTLIVKLLAKNLGIQVMQEKLKNVWKSRGGFKLRDVGYGCFMIKFDLEEDRLKVVSKGPG
jgi:hypothetical protein